MSTHYKASSKDLNELTEHASLASKQINGMSFIQLWPDFGLRFARVLRVDKVENSTINKAFTGSQGNTNCSKIIQESIVSAKSGKFIPPLN